MATMAKIREMSPYGLAAIAVFFILFMVISDADISSWDQGQNDLAAPVGIINGEKILLYEFRQAVDEEMDRTRSLNAQQGRADAEVDEATIRDRVWDQKVREILLRQNAEQLGIEVTNDEIRDVILDDPPQYLRQMFVDSAGTFDENLYYNVVTNPSFLQSDLGQSRQRVLEFQEMLIDVEDYIRQTRREEKLQNVVAVTIGSVPEAYLERQYAVENSSAQVEYLALRIQRINDDDVEISDADLKKYYDEHPDEFEQQPARKLRYVSFEEKPSERDSATAKKKEDRLAEAFKANATLEERAAAFDRYRLEYSGKTNNFASITSIPETKRRYIASLADSEVIGPVVLPDGTYFFKMEARRDGEQELTHASHILLNTTEDNQDSVLEVAQGILQRAQDGENFELMARTLSDDPSAQRNGGDLGYFPREQMVKEFADAAFDAPLGAIVGPVKTTFGYHIIKVHDRSAEEVQYSEISIVPRVSRHTKRSVLRDAREFLERVQNGENFDSAAKYFNLTPRETALFFENQPILGSRALSSFAFGASEGDLTETMDIKGFGRVVARLVEVREEGVKPFDEVMQQIRSKVLQQKKVDKALERISAIAGDIQNIPSLLSYTPADSAIESGTVSVKDNGSVPGLGQEYAFTATAFTLPVGEVSKAIKGERSAFFLRVLNREDADASGYATNRDSIMTTVSEGLKRQAFFRWIADERESADIVDNRGQFFNN